MEERSQAQLSCSLASILDAQRERIADDYRGLLEACGSRLVQDERTRVQCMEQACSIVTDVARALRGEPVPVAILSRRIGSSRASQGIHPSESLRAATLLFEATADAVARVPEADGIPAAELMAFVVVLNRIVSQRIRMAASTYMGFLLEGIEHVHLTERKRISREIHDRVGGNVASAYRQIEISVLLRGQDPRAADHAVELAEQAIRQTQNDLRALVLDLRTWEFQDGLESSLTSYLQHSRTEEKLEYALSVNGDESQLPPEVRGEVFLIIREAIRNVIRHADAKHLHVQVNITPHELYAVIEDDGVGVEMGPATERGGVRPREAGMASMRERAALLEGELVLISELNRGTRVELLVPLQPTPADDDD